MTNNVLLFQRDFVTTELTKISYKTSTTNANGRKSLFELSLRVQQNYMFYTPYLSSKRLGLHSHGQQVQNYSK
jgi:hypothetical protein